LTNQSACRLRAFEHIHKTCKINTTTVSLRLRMFKDGGDSLDRSFSFICKWWSMCRRSFTYRKSTVINERDCINDDILFYLLSNISCERMTYACFHQPTLRGSWNRLFCQSNAIIFRMH